MYFSKIRIQLLLGFLLKNIKSISFRKLLAVFKTWLISSKIPEKRPPPEKTVDLILHKTVDIIFFP